MVDVCERARGETFFLRTKQAAEMGGNAIIGSQYHTTELAQGLTEVLAYGTAVWSEPAS